MVIDAQELNPATSWPIVPDNILAEAVGDSAERIVLRVENRNAAARVVNTFLKTTPI